MDDKVISKTHTLMSIFWIGLFLINIFSLFFVLSGNRSLTITPVPAFKMMNTAYTILFVLIILYNYYIKKNKLHYKILNQIGEGKINVVASTLPLLKPVDDEISVVSGLLYHIRKQFTIIYLSLLLLTVGNISYIMLTRDRKNFYTFFIVTLFSLMINYPRKTLWHKIEYMKEEEEDHDPF